MTQLDPAADRQRPKTCSVDREQSTRKKHETSFFETALSALLSAHVLITRLLVIKKKLSLSKLQNWEKVDKLLETCFRKLVQLCIFLYWHTTIGKSTVIGKQYGILDNSVWIGEFMSETV